MCLRGNRKSGAGRRGELLPQVPVTLSLTLIAALGLFVLPPIACAASPVYRLENSALTGTATGRFHLEHLGDRWWFVAPDGHAFFPRAIALLDFGQSGAAGTDFRAYGAVALRATGNSAYRVLTRQARDSNTSDVLMAGRRYTLRAPGDTLVFGSSCFRPEFTKIQMSVRGVGGTLAWYYYSDSAARCATTPCWLPVNGNGRPYATDAGGVDSPFNLDTNAKAYQSRMVNANGFITPVAAPVIVAHGLPGSASYTYWAMPRDAHHNQIGNLSSPARIANISNYLNNNNYNLITPPRGYPMVAQWDILKGDTTHSLGTVKAGGTLVDHGQALHPYRITTGANRAQWWNWNVRCAREGSCTWPPDFSRLVIPGIDKVPRYYIKAVVTSRFTTAPVVSQIAEEETEDELLKARYGGSSVVTARIKWLNHDMPALEAAGINAGGQYSYSPYLLELGLHNRGKPYTGDGGLRLTDPVPLEYIMTLDEWTMRNAGAFSPPLVGSPVKNIYGNISATYCKGYEGRTPDVFDPSYYNDILNALRFAAGQGRWSGDGNVPPNGAVVYAVLSEDADDLYGVDLLSHEHLGAAVLMANPYMARDTHYGITYSDPLLYAKFALRDLLRAKYKTIGALNAAWGTHYTTWNTSAGRVANGTNAYGRGSGFLDEDGRHVIADCRDDDYLHHFTTRPAIRADLDTFVYAWSSRYARLLRRAWKSLPEAARLPPLFVPLYSGVDQAYQAMSPYIDGFWVDPTAASHAGKSSAAAKVRRDLERILRDTTRPLIVADYSSDFQQLPRLNASATKIAYNPIGEYSTMYLANVPYLFGAPVSLQFTDGKCAGRLIRPIGVQWNQVMRQTLLSVAGNLTPCLLPHGKAHIRRARLAASVYADAAERNRGEVARLNAILNLSGRDGIRQVAGLEFWGLYPEALVARSAAHGFGWMTASDHPRNGIADTPAAQVTHRDACAGGGGRRCRGGGNLMRGSGTLGDYLAHLHLRLE